MILRNRIQTEFFLWDERKLERFFLATTTTTTKNVVQESVIRISYLIQIGFRNILYINWIYFY